MDIEKKFTINLDKRIYYELAQIIEKNKIEKFIEDLVKSHLEYKKINQKYKEMSKDKARENDANEWTEISF